MSAAGSRRRGTATRLVLAAVTGVLAAGSLALATPAYAADPLPPIADEPPGGAVCAPELPTVDCQQEGGAPTPAAPAAAPAASAAASAAPTVSATPSSPASASATTPAAASSPTVTPSGAVVTTGTVAQNSSTSPRSAPAAPTLADTGAGRAGAWGAAGAGLLAAGSVLVLATRPRRLDA